jgi:hypothetical protein
LKGFFWISTKTVDNDVENGALDSREAPSGARSNKMPVARAKSGRLKIKCLATPSLPGGKKTTLLKIRNFCV